MFTWLKSLPLETFISPRQVPIAPLLVIMVSLEPVELPHWLWNNQPEKLSQLKWVICTNPSNFM